ncbi:MAG: hypothetical protein ACO3LA_07315 [Ilumatobacteraceae bacterium]
MALPQTSTSQQTSASAETSQEFNPTWRIEMALGGIYLGRTWVDVTTLVRRFSFTRGRADELQDFSTLSLDIIFDNREGFFTPEYSPLVTPARPMRVFCEYEGTRYQLCFGYVDEWGIEYPANGVDATATASCSGIFTLLQSARSDTFLDYQITTDRIIQMASEVADVEIDIPEPGTITMPEFELYETEVGAVIKASASTEFGQLYENKTGGIRFDGRGERFKQTQTAIVFGDDLDIETGYEDAEWDYSQNKIFNRVTITADPDDPQTVIDLASARRYGVKQFSADIDAINSIDDDAYNTTYAEALANFIVGRYAEPALRVNSIALNPADRQNIWDALLGLDINDRVVVNRRPPGYTPELTTSTSLKTQIGLENALLLDPTHDPYGTNLSRRTVTNGLTTSSEWSFVDPLYEPANISKEYEIITDESGLTYFQIRIFIESGYSPSPTDNPVVTLEHSGISIPAGQFATIAAYVYGGTMTVETNEETTQPFSVRCGYDLDFFGTGGGGVGTSSLSGFPVNIIQPQRIWTSLENTGVSAGLLSPKIIVEWGTAALPIGSVIEVRFGEFAVHGPRSTASFNGTYITTGGSKYKDAAYGTLDAAYVSANTDLYLGMLGIIPIPSIGERIERDCFVEQIRYDVAPGNDNWKVALGLSDAITGAYWTLGKSKLGVDTRLAI